MTTQFAAGQLSAGLGAIMTMNAQAQAAPVCSIGFTVKHDIYMNFSCFEAGRCITAKFAPEPDMSANDALRVNMLLSLIIINVPGQELPVRIMAYIRLHNLERHFTFS